MELGKKDIEIQFIIAQSWFYSQFAEWCNPQIVVVIIEYNNRSCAQYTSNRFIQANFEGSCV